MATRKKSRKSGATAAIAQSQLLEAMHQVWLAGLGAASKAQHGAPKLMQDLVAEGARVHAAARRTADKAVRDALGDVRSTISARVGAARDQASDAFDNLEKIFQTRVHRALSQLGMPSAEEVAALSRRVDSLNANIDRLAQTRGGRRSKQPRSRTMQRSAYASSASSR